MLCIHANSFRHLHSIKKHAALLANAASKRVVDAKSADWHNVIAQRLRRNSTVLWLAQSAGIERWEAQSWMTNAPLPIRPKLTHNAGDPRKLLGIMAAIGQADLLMYDTVVGWPGWLAIRVPKACEVSGDAIISLNTSHGRRRPDSKSYRDHPRTKTSGHAFCIYKSHASLPLPLSLVVRQEILMKPALIITFVLVGLCGCGSSKPETLIESGYDEQEMDAAIARARAEVDSFVSELSHPTGTDHAVKAPIEDGDNTEHFWLTDISFTNGEFNGTINNEPGIIGNVKIGQKWTIKKSEISDWMYLRNGKIHGNYTMRPLLKTMPEDEAAQFRSMLADP